MKRIHSIAALAFILLTFSCSVPQPVDLGQGFSVECLSAPWTGTDSQTRFSCHSNAERFFFGFDVVDSTLTMTEPFTAEIDVASGDRVEMYFSPCSNLEERYYCVEIDPSARVMDYSALNYRKFDYGFQFSTLEAFSQITSYGYRVNGSVSCEELKNLGIDLEDGFWFGIFLADYDSTGDVKWYSYTSPSADEPDFHKPGSLFFCKAEPKVEKRGVVVYPDDITSLGLEEWKNRFEQSGINLIGLHAATVNDPIDTLESFIKSTVGQEFLSLCEQMGVDVEYELHALEYLLPRELFETHPEYFRMDGDGMRQSDYNMCFSCEAAVEAMRPQLEALLKWIKPTTHRYYFWTDDKVGFFCNCERCSSLSESEQALIYENRLLKMLREYDPQATLAHIAYSQTLPAPRNVRPAEGVFLEYAPISRDYNYPLNDQQMEALRGNLNAFPAFSSHVLEYWLDESMFCSWKKTSPVILPTDGKQIVRDLEDYRSLGLSDFTCFATWLNGRYVETYGSTEKIFTTYGESF